MLLLGVEIESSRVNFSCLRLKSYFMNISVHDHLTLDILVTSV